MCGTTCTLYLQGLSYSGLSTHPLSSMLTSVLKLLWEVTCMHSCCHWTSLIPPFPSGCLDLGILLRRRLLNWCSGPVCCHAGHYARHMLHTVHDHSRGDISHNPRGFAVSLVRHQSQLGGSCQQLAAQSRNTRCERAAVHQQRRAFCVIIPAIGYDPHLNVG
jgi:hypothetical protein